MADPMLFEVEAEQELLPITVEKPVYNGLFATKPMRPMTPERMAQIEVERAYNRKFRALLMQDPDARERLEAQDARLEELRKAAG